MIGREASYCYRYNVNNSQIVGSKHLVIITRQLSFNILFSVKYFPSDYQ